MKRNTLFITQAAMIAAIYVVLLCVFEPISFGAIQCRVAEALTVLPFFTPAAIPGLTIGCFIGNIIGGADVLDIVFGTFATCIGAFGSYALRRYKFLVPLPPILANTIIVPWVLRFAYAESAPIYFLMATVGVGEIIACGVLGLLLLFVLERYKNIIFPMTREKA